MDEMRSEVAQDRSLALGRHMGCKRQIGGCLVVSPATGRVTGQSRAIVRSQTGHRRPSIRSALMRMPSTLFNFGLTSRKKLTFLSFGLSLPVPLPW